MLDGYIVISLLASILLFVSGQWFWGLCMAAVCAWLAIQKAKSVTATINTANQATEVISQPAPARTPYTAAKYEVGQAMLNCQKSHPEATSALLWLANADGSISKQEVRLIFKFCEKFGVTIKEDAYKGLDIAPPKDYLGTRGDLEGACNLLRSLRDKPMPYKAALHGAAHAMAGSNKSTSKAKQSFLDTAESLLT